METKTAWEKTYEQKNHDTLLNDMILGGVNDTFQKKKMILFIGVSKLSTATEVCFFDFVIY